MPKRKNWSDTIQEAADMMTAPAPEPTPADPPAAVPDGNGKKPPLRRSPEERFLVVAPGRVNNAAKALRVLARCFGAGYASTEEQRKRVSEYVNAAWRVYADALEGTRQAPKEGFAL